MNTISNTAPVVIIFGGEGYIGSAAASIFEQSGWIAIKASRKVLHNDTHIAADIGDSASVTIAFNTILQKYGHVDAIVHAASPALERVPFISSGADSFQAHIQTAVLGTMHIVHTALASNTVKNIVVITSQATDATSSKMGAYPWVKKMQRELCSSLARMLPERIRIHTIAPGFLPGGLNNDLPKSVQHTFAAQKDGSIADATVIARTIVDICEHKPQYASSGDIDGETSMMTPF